MPRSSRGRSSAPKRPVAAPARPAAPPQVAQARPASTMARPPANAQQRPLQQAQQASGGSGLFGQMASTAAGVAVGSSIGHALGGFFGGGSSAPAEQQESAAANPADNGYAMTQTGQSGQAYGPCANDIGSFRRCMDDNQGSLTICGWYLDQLKACQQAAAPY